MNDEQNASQGATGAAANQKPVPKAAAPQTATPPQTQTGTQPQTGGVLEKFDIPESVRTQHPDLVTLILQTESMTDDERQYWFQILPIMTDEQIKKLREILSNEKKQLEQIDEQYQQELKRINEKHVSEWKAHEAKEKREKLQAAESTEEQKEKSQEEDLLKKLQQM